MLIGCAIPALSALTVGTLVATFTATGDASARTAVWIVVAVLWPVPIAMAATVGWHKPGEGLRLFLSSLFITVIVIPLLVPVLGVLWGLYSLLWPGAPDVPPSGAVYFLGAWFVVGIVALFALAITDKSDPYAGGWAP